MTAPRFLSVFAHVFFRFRIHGGGACINFNKPFVVLCLAFLCGSSLVACTRLKIKRFSPPPPFLSNADPASLSPGLSMNSQGLITGSPTTTGTFSFDVTVTDSAIPPQSATGTVTININP